MKMLLKFKQFYLQNPSLAVRWIVLGVLLVYLVYALVRSVVCWQIISVCGISDLMVVFPFYILTTSLFGQVGFFAWILLYLFSAAVYVTVVYYISGWIEQVYLKSKNRPDFTLKRV